MVKPKIQVKAAVKAKTGASSAAAVSPPLDDVRVAAKKEANDMKKSPRGQPKEVVTKAPVKTAAQTREDDVTTTTAKSAAKDPAAVTEIVRPMMTTKEPSLLAAKISKVKAVKEGKMQVKDAEKTPLAPQDIEARRMRLKNLIVQGKERGYLTYAEINDHLPDDMLDAEQIENIISMINDVGISVYDEAPTPKHC